MVTAYSLEQCLGHSSISCYMPFVFKENSMSFYVRQSSQSVITELSSSSYCILSNRLQESNQFDPHIGPVSHKIAMPREPHTLCFFGKCLRSTYTLQQCLPQHNCVCVELHWHCDVGMTRLTGPLPYVPWGLFAPSPRLAEGAVFPSYIMIWEFEVHFLLCSVQTVLHLL